MRKLIFILSALLIFGAVLNAVPDPGGQTATTFFSQGQVLPGEMSGAIPVSEGFAVQVFQSAAVSLSLVVGLALIGLLIANAFAPYFLMNTGQNRVVPVDGPPERYDKSEFPANLMTGAQSTEFKRTKSPVLKSQSA